MDGFAVKLLKVTIATIFFTLLTGLILSIPWGFMLFIIAPLLFITLPLVSGIVTAIWIKDSSVVAKVLYAMISILLGYPLITIAGSGIGGIISKALFPQ